MYRQTMIGLTGPGLSLTIAPLTGTESKHLLSLSLIPSITARICQTAGITHSGCLSLQSTHRDTQSHFTLQRLFTDKIIMMSSLPLWPLWTYDQLLMLGTIRCDLGDDVDSVSSAPHNICRQFHAADNLHKTFL